MSNTNTSSTGIFVSWEMLEECAAAYDDILDQYIADCGEQPHHTDTNSTPYEQTQRPHHADSTHCVATTHQKILHT
jgi:hypothetical protein